MKVKLKKITKSPKSWGKRERAREIKTENQILKLVHQYEAMDIQ